MEAGVAGDEKDQSPGSSKERLIVMSAVRGSSG